MLQQALNGDLTACKMLLDRVLPPLKPEAEIHPLPELLGADPRRALLALLGDGEIDPKTALDVIAVLSSPTKSGYPRIPSSAEQRAQAKSDAEFNKKFGLVGFD